jgi:hypothetical protein
VLLSCSRNPQGHNTGTAHPSLTPNVLLCRCKIDCPVEPTSNLLGKKVSVKWGGVEEWHDGVVCDYRNENCKHVVSALSAHSTGQLQCTQHPSTTCKQTPYLAAQLGVFCVCCRKAQLLSLCMSSALLHAGRV